MEAARVAYLPAHRASPFVTRDLLSERGQPLADTLIARVVGEDAFEVLARHPFLSLDEVVGRSLGESEVARLVRPQLVA